MIDPSKYPVIQCDRLRAILEKIKANPSCWNQLEWHCGTAHCFGGHAQIASGAEPNKSTTRRDARVWLGLTRSEAVRLFAPDNSLQKLEQLVEDWTTADYAQGGVDSDGFDRDGRDSDGFDDYGYDRDGRDRDGFDRYNRDRDGYDSAGIDRDGRDREGYDRDGLNHLNQVRK